MGGAPAEGCRADVHLAEVRQDQGARGEVTRGEEAGLAVRGVWKDGQFCGWGIGGRAGEV